MRIRERNLERGDFRRALPASPAREEERKLEYPEAVGTDRPRLAAAKKQLLEKDQPRYQNI